MTAGAGSAAATGRMPSGCPSRCWCRPDQRQFVRAANSALTRPAAKGAGARAARSETVRRRLEQHRRGLVDLLRDDKLGERDLARAAGIRTAGDPGQLDFRQIADLIVPFAQAASIGHAHAPAPAETGW